MSTARGRGGRGGAQRGGYTATHQDWAPQGINNAPPVVRAVHDDKVVNKIRQQGGTVEVTSRVAAGGNKQGGNQDHLHERKIANSDDDYVHKTVDVAISTNLRRARAKKEMTQAQLAMGINEKVSVVQSYEKGDAIPNGQLISRMERVLGLRLRGAHALEPF